MEHITLTALRQNIFQIADRVLATGEPVLIERDGQRLVLAPEPMPARLDRLPKRTAIAGDPEELVDVSPWDEREWRKNQSLR
ncbi:hypothetical protein ACKVEX_03525 [Rhodocyclaceae bacterium SMB388]